MKQLTLAPSSLRELQLGDALAQNAQLFLVILTLRHRSAPPHAAPVMHGPQQIEA
ncbi:hypothetical protein [Sorangium sp. So ce1078]|uniref:hypothetical protein n=1 Tax=Sorangium sp. So ce1078 TaxID=3133329 RepID=UPI003F634173